MTDNEQHPAIIITSDGQVRLVGPIPLGAIMAAIRQLEGMMIGPAPQEETNEHDD